MEKPWESGLKLPEGLDVNKSDRSKWQIRLTTQHAFISGFEGMTAQMRVSYENHNIPHRMHALITDYDAHVTEARLAEMLVDPPCEFMPAWAIITGSGNLRLVWMFERSIMLAHKDLIIQFLLMLQKKLDLKSWHGALDEKAMADPSQYYEIGFKWIPMKAGAFVPQSYLELWMLNASKKVKLDDDEKDVYQIPMERIAEEVAQRYPDNKWSGPFEEGRRGIRFWDPNADNDTGAVILKSGMMAFSGEQAFMSWRKLLGDAFVSQFKADKVGKIRENVVFDSEDFWILMGDEWVSKGRADFTQKLRVLGFSDKGVRGATCTEIDEIEVDLKDNCRVYKALPFIHFPPGVIVYEDKKYLNISNAVCMQPAKDSDVSSPVEALKTFPFVWKLLKALFENDYNPNDPMDQMYYFLAWLQRFYLGGLTMRPTQGQAVVLIGPPSAGKTLLAQSVIAPLVGGMADATAYFVEDSKWTARILEKPLLVVDDAKPVTSPEALKTFSASLKKVVANSRMVYSEKFKQEGEVPHFGRPIILANFDCNSMQVIPDLDMSNRDKIMLFKSPDKVMKFPEWDVITKTLAQELPYFARFLQLWRPPNYVISVDRRFGINAYHHPILAREAAEAGANGIMHELLCTMLETYMIGHEKQGYWEGTTTTLSTDLKLASDGLSDREFKSPKALSIAMQNLMTKESDHIEHQRLQADGRDKRLWRIKYSLLNPNSVLIKKEDTDAGNNGEKLETV